MCHAIECRDLVIDPEFVTPVSTQQRPLVLDLGNDNAAREGQGAFVIESGSELQGLYGGVAPSSADCMTQQPATR